MREREVPSGRLQEVRQWDLLCPVADCSWRMRLQSAGPLDVPARGDHPAEYVAHYLDAHGGGG